MEHANGDGRKALALWAQWQNWALCALLLGIIWFAQQDRLRIASQAQQAIDQSNQDAAKIQKLQDQQEEMTRSQERVEKQVDAQNQKLDFIVQNLVDRKH